ncbi:ankyrin repeat protein [Ophiostoma piceae UAMH 11346]|uniref:Ankyrin repeat protein n=1 Tax=Ophiostoma piceae (strain UAMH 11346) TaxID=1262450 RepID=S3BSM3_OPHP1|nr:ankyrin repeat protein [Ophiostoma piceae UAMH 11346]
MLPSQHNNQSHPLLATTALSMSFSQLPLELVEHVLAYVVGDYWSFYSSTTTLPYRLVCKLFDRIVSQNIFRTFDLNDIYDRNIRHDTAVWLLRTKSTMGVKHQTPILESIRLTGLMIFIWKLYQAIDTKQTVEYSALHARVMTGMYAVRVANQRGSDLWWDLKYTKVPLVERPTSPLPVKDYDAAEYLRSMTKYGTLCVAAYLGDVPLIQGLLQAGDDPNQKHEDFGSPLYAAAFAGCTDSVALLLDAGAHATDSQGPKGTPIEVAVQRGHEATVRLLVDRRVDGGRALWDALARKRLSMADLLLERGCVDVNIRREESTILHRPITLAIVNKHRRLALVLARRPELRPNDVDRYQTPPLIEAIYKKWDDVAEALLARPDIDAAKPDRRGGTALHAACKTGNLHIMQLLLARNDVAVNKLNRSGRTALGSAIAMTEFASVGLILQRDDCDASLGSGIENRPLILASQGRNCDLVKLLLQRPEVCHAADFARVARDALGHSVKNADGRIFDMLRSACPSIGLNDKDGYGVPFAHLAVERRSDAVSLQMLLAAGDIDTNLLHGGATLLVAAVIAENVEAVAILLAREDVQVNANNHKRTALWNAIGLFPKRLDMTRMLLAHADIDPNLVSVGIRTTVSRPVKEPSASTTAYSYVFREFDMQQDVSGAPLEWAVSIKGYESMKLLLAHNATNPNTTDGNGRTPLWWAVYKRKSRCMPPKSAEATRLLLAHPATDPNLADNQGWTPLLLAVFLDCGEEVEALLAHSAIDIRRPNEDGCTPLEMAERCERVEIKARLLAWSETGS